MDVVAPRWPIRALLVCVCLAAALWVGSVLKQERRLRSADHALARGSGERAIALARAATGPTVRAGALRVEGLAHLRLGDNRSAAAALGRAVALRPEDWALRYDRAIVLRRLGRDRDAAREMGRALQLNPRATLPPGFSTRRPSARG